MAWRGVLGISAYSRDGLSVRLGNPLENWRFDQLSIPVILVAHETQVLCGTKPPWIRVLTV
jgi:hypothetical protein